jgi:hypothetical protein
MGLFGNKVVIRKAISKLRTKGMVRGGAEKRLELGMGGRSDASWIMEGHVVKERVIFSMIVQNTAHLSVFD